MRVRNAQAANSYRIGFGREAFEELMDSCRNNAMAAGNATNPIIFEPMVMSILLGQQKRLRKLEQELKVFEKTQQASSIDQANKKPQL
jgi:hypothetical protein